MNDFKELDTAQQVVLEGRWYIGVKPERCEYLHRDLNLHPETINYNTGAYDGLWVSEIEALMVCKQYYILHGRGFPYVDRFNELLGAPVSPTACESQPMVFN